MLSHLSPCTITASAAADWVLGEMKFEALMLSAFLVGASNCFAPYSPAAREFARDSSPRSDRGSAAIPPSHHATGQPCRRSRKRQRTRAAPMESSDEGGSSTHDPTAAAASAAVASAGTKRSVSLVLPPRLQETVDRLSAEATLLDKSKMLVELGDAFALTDSAVLPHDSAAAAAWSSRRVPGCVSEVHVAVSVSVSDVTPPPSPFSSSSSSAAATREGSALGDDTGAVVSIRGTADARLSRGILALVASGLEGESPRTVLNLCGKTLAAAVGLRAGLTNSRINGLGNVLDVVQAQVRVHLGRAASAAGAADATAPTDAAEPTSAEPACPPGPASAESVFSSAIDSPTLMSGSGSGFEEGGRSWGSDASGWVPLPGAEDEVAMLLSGGVDSSVAMRLLQDEGYRVRAFYLKIWLEDELSHLGECPWEEDLRYAAAVCEQAGVPLEVVPLQREYWEKVVSYTVREAREGRTPNPDVMCNSRIKFGMFYDHVGRHFQHVATGHYARLESVETPGAAAAVGDSAGDGGRDGGALALKESNDGGATERGQVRLLLSPDAIKDQTYFLCALNQAQLRKALFPVGAYTKERIRELAESYDLPTKSRKDSQGICFLGKLKFDDFLRHYLGEAPGTVIDRETGEHIGEHRGLWFHTIGQRKGVGPGLKPGFVNLGPWYVSGKDMVGNVLEVTNNRDAIDEPRESFQVEALQWIAGFPPAELEREGSMRLQVKTRHGPQMKGCILRLREETKPACAGEGDVTVAKGEPDAVGGGGGGGVGGGGASGGNEATGVRGYVQLDSKDSALAPGQFAAFYLGDECLGAGVMGDSSAAPGRAEEAVAPPASVEFPERISYTPALQESAVGA